MDKNTITGFVLIALVIIGFSWYSRPSEAELQEMARQDSIQQVQKQAEQAQALQQEEARLLELIDKAANLSELLELERGDI